MAVHLATRQLCSGLLQLLTCIGKRHSPLKLVSDSPVLCTNHMDFLHKLLFKAWAIFILERPEDVSCQGLFNILFNVEEGLTFKMAGFSALVFRVDETQEIAV